MPQKQTGLTPEELADIAAIQGASSSTLTASELADLEAMKSVVATPERKQGKVVPPWMYGAEKHGKASLPQKAVSTAYEAGRGFLEGGYIAPLRFGADVMQSVSPASAWERDARKGILAKAKAANLTPEQMAEVEKSVARKKIPELPRGESTWFGQDVVGGLAELAGAIKGVPGKAISGIPAKNIPGIAPTIAKSVGSVTKKAASPFLKNALPKIAGESAGMTAFSLLGGGAEDTEGAGERAKSGAIMGAIFGATKAARLFKKAPYLDQILRQFATRKLGQLTQTYDNDSLGRIKEALTSGKPLVETIPGVVGDIVNEALFTYFSWKKGAGGLRKGEAEEVTALVGPIATPVTQRGNPLPVDMRPGKPLTVTHAGEVIPRDIPPDRPLPVSAKPEVGNGGVTLYSIPIDKAVKGLDRTLFGGEGEESPTLYRGTAKGQPTGPSDRRWPGGEGMFTTTDPAIAATYGGEGNLVSEIRLKPGTVVADLTRPAKENLPMWKKIMDTAVAEGRLSKQDQTTLLDMIERGEVGAGLRGDVSGGMIDQWIDDAGDIYPKVGVQAVVHKNPGTQSIDVLIKDMNAIDHHAPVGPSLEPTPPPETIPEGATVPPDTMPERVAAIPQIDPKIAEGILAKMERGERVFPAEQKILDAYLDSKGMRTVLPPGEVAPGGSERVNTRPLRGEVGKPYDPAAAARSGIDSLRDEIANAESGPLKLLADVWRLQDKDRANLLKRAERNDTRAEKGTGTAEALGQMSEPTVEELDALRAEADKIAKGDKDPSGGVTLYSIPLDKAIKAIDNQLFGGESAGPVSSVARDSLFKKIETQEKRRQWGRSVGGNLSRMGGPGEVLNRQAENYLREGAQTANHAFQAVPRSVGLMLKAHGIPRIAGAVPVWRNKLSQKAITRLADMVEGREQPKNPLEAEAFKIMSYVFNDISRRATDAGVETLDMKTGKRKPWAPRAEYWPREYENLDGFLSDKKFAHLRDKAIDLVAQKRFPEIYASDRDRALQQADALFEAQRSDLKSKRYGHLESERILDDAALASLRAEWEKTNPGEDFPLEPKYTVSGLTDYIDKAYDRIAWVKHLGNDVSMATVKGGAGLAPKLVADILPTIQERHNRDYAQGVFQNYLGRGLHDSSMDKLLRRINEFQNIKLAFASIPNAFQWMTNTIPELGVEDTIRTIGEHIRFPFDKAIRDFVSDSGAMSYQEAAKKIDTADLNKVSRLTQSLLKVNGFSGEEKYLNATFAALGGRNKSYRLLDKLIESDGRNWRDPQRIAELKRMGWEPETIAEVIKNGALRPEDVSRLADAGWYMKRMTQFAGDLLSRPKTWQTPLGSVIFKFKNFPFQQTGMLAGWGKEFVKFLQPYKIIDGKPHLWVGREGDPAKLMKGAALLAGAGYLVTEVKKRIYDFFGIQYYADLIEGQPIGLQLLAYMTQAGSLGLAMDAVNALSRGDKGLISLALGPTATDLMNVIPLASEVSQTAWKAISQQDPKWFSIRSKAIEYQIKNFVSKLNQPARIAMMSFFPKFKEAKDFQQWGFLMREARDRYFTLYKSHGPEEANSFWKTIQATQEDEWEERFGRRMKKPRFSEYKRWLEGREKDPQEVPK